jgi:hypothetical protein
MSLDSYTFVPVDLRGYDRLVFSVKVEEGDSHIPMSVHLACSTVSSDATPLRGPFFISADTLPLSPGWQVYPLKLSDFRRVDWNGPDIDETACLGLVDEISIMLQPNLADGDAFAGKVTIDDVFIQ